MAGASVCRRHGGGAPQVKAKARQRLEEAADRMARQLLRMAGDDSVNDSVKLAAIKDALDRAGVSAKTAVEVSVGPMEPWQDLLSGLAVLASGSRAEARERRGEHTALADVLDAEVVATDADLHYCDGCERPFPAELPDWLDDWPAYCSACRSERGLPDPPRQARSQAPDADDADLRGGAAATSPGGVSQPVRGSSQPPAGGLVPFGDAVEQLAARIRNPPPRQ